MQPAIIQQLLDRYPPGSAIHRAVEFGIDLTLNIENLKLTPTERLRRAEQICKSMVRFQQEFLRAKTDK